MKVSTLFAHASRGVGVLRKMGTLIICGTTVFRTTRYKGPKAVIKAAAYGGAVALDKAAMQDDVWRSVVDRAEDGFKREAEVRVVVPKKNLLRVLMSCESSVVALDLLPKFADVAHFTSPIRDGEEVVGEMEITRGTDALRVTDVAGGDPNSAAGDSVILIGCHCTSRKIVGGIKPRKKETKKDKAKNLLEKLKG